MIFRFYRLSVLVFGSTIQLEKQHGGQCQFRNVVFLTWNNVFCCFRIWVNMCNNLLYSNVHSVVFWLFLCNLNVKMASDKIKVAVRVRPFSRRGKLVSIIYYKEICYLMGDYVWKNLSTPCTWVFDNANYCFKDFISCKCNALRAKLLKYSLLSIFIVFPEQFCIISYR